MRITVGPAYELLHRIIKQHGAPGVAAPPGPDFHLFANPTEAERLLSDAGYRGIEQSVVPCAWDYERPEGLFEMFERGTVRAALVLASQPPQNLAAVRTATIDEVRRRFAYGNGWRVQAPAALIVARH